MTTTMLHLEIVGSSPRQSVLQKFDYLDKPPPRTPTTPQAQFIRLPSRRGLSRTPLEDHHPIDNIREIDILTRPCGHNIQRALESSQVDTPCSSGRSSPTITETQSPLSVSHGGWTTGNTTERSSLDSLDDFDKQASNTVFQHFEEIEAVLFEGPRETLTPQADVVRECWEWSSQFPHLRVLGKQACPPKDMGYYHVPTSHSSRPTSSSLHLDVTDNDISSPSDSQGLSLIGCSVSASQAPIDSLSSDRNLSTYSFLVEEVIEEDGLYEDVIAVDYKNLYEDNMEYKKQITPRRRRVGYPPITPNACVRDSVISGAFDHIWQEVMSWMRQLLEKYTSEITDSKHDGISYSPITNPATPRENSLFTPNRQFSFQRSSTYIDNQKNFNEILQIKQIKCISSKNRYQLMDPSESHVPSSARPGSSVQSHLQPRPMSNLRPSHRGGRGGRLAPLAKNSNTEDEKTSGPSAMPSAMEALKVRGLTPMSSDHLPSSPPNFQRNGALPPLETERSQRLQHQSYRATSAIDNKDMRFMSIRDRSHIAAEQARPNTTHAMRSETPFGGSASRRSSTPLGNSFTARNALHNTKSLDVRGNSLQPGGDSSHFHPDIQEDQQESPGEEVYRAQWNAPHASHSIYRRNRLSMN